jgi:ParB family chromosome partitioning protein
MRALTALKQAGIERKKTDGTPPEMPLAKIMHDPDNPRPPLQLRTREEQQKQSELNTNIKKRGVKSPISLRPHPTIPDRWVINHGHCRYDAAEAAGFATIPYFIDPNFDSYDQVAENLHRSDLSIWAIAAFIKRKLVEGQSKAEIAERLGKGGQNYVTEHLALVDAPSCLHQAYANAVRSPRTLYDLRRAYDEFPEQVDVWCGSGARITRDTIKDLLERLRQDVTGKSTTTEMAPSSHQAGDGAHQTIAVGILDQDSRRTRENNTRSEELRHDVTGSPGTGEPPKTARLRRDVESNSKLTAKLTDLTSLGASGTIEGIRVRYKGKAAKVAPNSTVRIVLDGSADPFDVLLSELELELDGTR